MHEPSKLDSDLDKKGASFSNPILAKDLGCDLTENDTIPTVEILVNPLQPMQTCNIPMQKLEGLVNGQNKDSTIYNEFKQRESASATIRRSTCSMATVSILVTIHQ